MVNTDQNIRNKDINVIKRSVESVTKSSQTNNENSSPSCGQGQTWCHCRYVTSETAECVLGNAAWLREEEAVFTRAPDCVQLCIDFEISMCVAAHPAQPSSVSKQPCCCQQPNLKEKKTNGGSAPVWFWPGWSSGLPTGPRQIQDIKLLNMIFFFFFLIWKVFIVFMLSSFYFWYLYVGL